MSPRITIYLSLVLTLFAVTACGADAEATIRTTTGANGDGEVTITGDLKLWHKITVTLSGPFARETDDSPNPFTDHNMTVHWSHPDGSRLTVPGYFAADGDAANTSAGEGNAWRAHFSPARTGVWTYRISFRTGNQAAIDSDAASQPVAPYDGITGTVDVEASDKSEPDLRAQGRLTYVGSRYLQHAGSGRYFLKVGADAPETLLAYRDFDNTHAGHPGKAPLKSWAPHVQDWAPGDPTWGNGKGKGLIGAVNYLSSKGCNAFSFLTYNAGGDGDNVWPFLQRDHKQHYDCSKLDQWGIVFDHAASRGMFLHFKLQETENDDNRTGQKGTADVPEALDGGDLGPERRLYLRELIARFSHHPALNWNLGEENTQSTEQQRAMIDYIAATDPYHHLIVVHTYPNQQDKVYTPLLGSQSQLTGASLQNSSLDTTHAQTVKWVQASEMAGKPWVVAFDESGSAAHGQCPDLGYNGFDGHDRQGNLVYTQHEVRKLTLWGTLMGGGAGCEYYFGYQFDENDIRCEDWRSRDQSWDYCRIAIDFFHSSRIPFWMMSSQDELVGNPNHDNSRYCLAAKGRCYLVYLPSGGTCTLDLSGDSTEFQIAWFNPRDGGELRTGTITRIQGGRMVSLGPPPADPEQDWLVVLRTKDTK
ncbi:MAG: DUF5060 domain-containing protein [Planctomycetaceae bacterium]|nr:DUF5060 domain-containing protein [Planctomycetaceae bacterium]